MILLTHPTGNQNVRAAAISLEEAGLLGAFYTTIASFEGDMLSRISQLPGLREIQRRAYTKILEEKTSTFPLLESLRLAASKASLNTLTKRDVGILSVDAVYRNLDRQVAQALSKHKSILNIKAVYAYDGGALQSFKAAEQVGIKRFFELPTGYWRAARALDEREKEINPEWASSLPGLEDTEAKLLSKDEELKHASHIFVASNYVKRTLEYYPGELAPVSVIPYGFPPVGKPKSSDQVLRKDSLRVLFVGGLTQRKGISYMFDAIRPLKNHVKLTVVGRRATGLVSPILDKSLREVNYIESLHHHQVLEQMRRHDVLVFPSLFEGFGLVISEAMSQGTPVITTTSTAGVDLIEHGVDGWVVAPGDSEQIREALESVIDDRARLLSMSHEALRTASTRGWGTYKTALAEKVRECLE